MKKLLAIALLAIATTQMVGCAGMGAALERAAAERRAEEARKLAAWNAMSTTQRQNVRREECRQAYEWTMRPGYDYGQSQMALANKREDAKMTLNLCMSRAREQT